jgi:DNA-binding GntR family transcriptional regulator
VTIGDFLDEAPRARLTARDIVAGDLRKEIVHGTLAPGTKLSPGQLAERFGVSQTPAREALQLLAAEGLVNNDAYRGARVSELTFEEYEELVLMRIELEGLAARLGAERISDEGIAEMRALFEGMEEATSRNDIERFYDRDRRFHLTHYSASRRGSLVRRIRNLRLSAERYMRQAYTTRKVGLKATLENHRKLLEAVARHDGERCEKIIRADMLRTLDALAEQFASNEATEASVGSDVA